MLAHDPKVRLAVTRTLVRTHDLRDLGAAPVGDTGHQRRDAGGIARPPSESWGQSRRHQQGTQIGVADAELAVVPRRATDGLGREVRETDGDVHRRDDQFDGLDEPLRLERAIGPRNFIRLSDARLHDELSSDMYSLHGLEAVIRPLSGWCASR